MSYLIIVLVVALALAPIMAFKPSKAQKHQVALRDRARELGLQVQIGDLPQTHRQQVRREDPQLGVIYRLLWRHPDARFVQIHYLLHRDETEPNRDPPAIRDALQQVLAALPAAVIAVDFTNVGVAVYWREQGDTATVAAIAEQLRALQARLQSLAIATPAPSPEQD